MWKTWLCQETENQAFFYISTWQMRLVMLSWEIEYRAHTQKKTSTTVSNNFITVKVLKHTC